MDASIRRSCELRHGENGRGRSALRQCQCQLHVLRRVFVDDDKGEAAPSRLYGIGGDVEDSGRHLRLVERALARQREHQNAVIFLAGADDASG